MSARAESLREDLRLVLLDPQEAMGVVVAGRTRAAVLVPLYLERGELHVVLTRRRADLRRHPGEISFPGGRYEQGERDLLATALREAEEEIGLPASGVEIVGALTPTPTIATGYAVYPFAGVIEPGTRWILAPREVEQVIELSVVELRAGFGRRRLIRRGLPILTDAYTVGEQLIWGATARILSDLLRRLASLPAYSRQPPNRD
jgi:8-oxo-dGTP pyrophosphatase MutT (NUDIX family)